VLFERRQQRTSNTETSRRALTARFRRRLARRGRPASARTGELVRPSLLEE